MNISIKSFFIVFAVIFSSVQAKKVVYKSEKFDELSDTTKKMLVLPVLKVATEYYDDTQIEPAVEFSDSFFVKASNDLISFKMRRKYPLISVDTSDVNSISLNYNIYSKLNSTGKKENTSVLIRALAEKYNVSFVLVPQRINMKHITSQPSGWRESPSYQKPVSYKALARVNMQVWNAQGDLLLEKEGFADTGRPVLYRIVKGIKKLKDKKMDDDIAAYAKRFYSPPIVRALNKAILKSLKF